VVSGRERRVTPWHLRAGDTPDWSPDGRRILFHDNLDGPSTVSANLYTIRPNGSHLQQLTFEEGGVVNHLGSCYSPDGTMITFARRPATGGHGGRRVHHARGWHAEGHPNELYDSYPDWVRGPQS
jgi:TolB protein